MVALHHVELGWIAAFQGDGGVRQVMIWFSLLGYEALPYVPPFVFYFVSRRRGAKLYLLLSFVGPLTLILKLVFHSPRPHWMDPHIKELTDSWGYGLPSGHALGASIVWPYAAKTLDKLWILGAGLVIVLLVSASRVYLGVHFVSDVLAAWLIASATWYSFESLQVRLSEWFKDLKIQWQVALALWTATILLVIGKQMQLLLNGVTDPPSWAAFSSNARGLSGLVPSCGEFFGTACGVIMTERWAVFEDGGALWKRGAALAYALLGAALLHELDKLRLIPRVEPFQTCFDFLLGGLPNLWILFVAPWIFMRAGLSFGTYPILTPRKSE